MNTIMVASLSTPKPPLALKARKAISYLSYPFLFLTLGLQTLGAAATLDDCKSNFTSRRETIEQETGRVSGKLMIRYFDALGDLLKTSTRDGNLEFVLTVQTELTRLKKEQSLPRTLTDTPQRSFQKIQAVAIDRQFAIRLDELEKTIALMGKYEQALDNMIRTLVREEKIDEASVAKKESDQLDFAAMNKELETLQAEMKSHEADKKKYLPSMVAPPAMDPSAISKAYGYEGKLYALCDDQFKMYLNGKPLVEGTLRGGVTEKDVSFKENDMLLVEVIDNGGRFGFSCAILFEDKGRCIVTGSELWKSYKPKVSKAWYAHPFRSSTKDPVRPKGKKRGNTKKRVQEFSPVPITQIWGGSGGKKAYLMLQIKMNHFDRYTP